MRTFDVVAVGGGPRGEEAAARLSDRGLSVALVEDRLVGGECGHRACIPSKAVPRRPEVLAEAGADPGRAGEPERGPNAAAMLAPQQRDALELVRQQRRDQIDELADIGRPEREIEVRPSELPLPAELPLEPAPAPSEPRPIEDPVPA